MVNNRVSYIVLVCSALLGLGVQSCDTARTIEDPNKNYFFKHYGSDGDQEGVDVVVDTEGFIYMLGTTMANANTNTKQLYLVKTDDEGVVLWEKIFGGKFEEEAIDLELTTNNRLVVLANSKKGSTENDVLVMTFSLDGIKQDSTLVGLQTKDPLKPIVEADDKATSIAQTNDGFIVSGSTTSVSSKAAAGGFTVDDVSDALHLRFTSNLTLFDEANWTRTSGTRGTDGASKVYQLNSLIYYIFGYTNINSTATNNPFIGDYNFWIFPLGSTGVAGAGQQMYPGTITNDDILTSVVTPLPGSSDGFLLAGTSADASGNFDIYITKLRNTLQFNETVDFQISKPLSVTLGKPDINKAKVSAFPSASSGYLLLANEKTSSTNSFYLTKINNRWEFEWNSPQSLIFGGQNEDYIGAVAELPDGKIILVGTMSIGDEGQQKMTLIKVNKNGKFRE